ncbi:MAG: putative porin [Steroidobacteraceae bacterium]|jgi:hypothetical protein|nr:putative porin [Steroidobacteraceae bacterium]
MIAKRSVLAGTMMLACAAGAMAQEGAPQQALQEILLRLDALERRNEQLTQRVEELTRQNEALRAGSAEQTAAEPPKAAMAAAGDAVASRIGFNGDLRYRHEQIDDESLDRVRTRATLRARFGATIAVTDSVDAEIAIATGGRNPRSASATLGAASSRKDIGLDLGYVRWRATDELAFTVGKMREPYVRPGVSTFFDNEIRPEGAAVHYNGPNGVFGSAFHFWLEERSVQGDSMLSGGQLGWSGKLGMWNLKAGAGYYDYGSVRGRAVGFGGGLVNQAGNSVIASGGDLLYAYDYDIGQLFAEGAFAVAGLPVTLFVDYAENFAADNGLDTAWNAGVRLGRANAPGRWEAVVFQQRMEKDALFGQWIDSSFAGGVTDNEGRVYRLTWAPVRDVRANLTYFDTRYNVDVGSDADYDRWRIDFNFVW